MKQAAITLALCCMFGMAQASDQPISATGSTHLSNLGEARVIRFTSGKPMKITGELLDSAPDASTIPRLKRSEEERDGQLGPPMRLDDLPLEVSKDAAETKTDERAPGDLVFLRNDQLTPSAGNVSSVAEPSIGSAGRSFFETYNWYASIASANGTQRSFISPYTMFPNAPAAFSAGFCCDQRAAHDSNRNLVFWFLQYIKTNSTATGTSGVRVAVAQGASGLGSNTWMTYDFTPAQLGLSGVWFDFPHMQLSANFLYFTLNMFQTAGDSFAGSTIYRIPLSQLAAGQPVTVDTFFTPSFGSLVAVHGAAAEGVRRGRTTMYFASVTSNTGINILTWPESAPQPTVTPITGLSTTTFGANTCTAPDNSNPCGRNNARHQGGWIAGNELGFMWSSAQQIPARPFPYTRVAIFNPDTLALISEPDIWSSTSALLYPIVAVNERGNLGGVIDNLGGNVLNSVRVLFRDEFSTTGQAGWETAAAATGDTGGVSSWGDYNGVVPHEKFPNTWLGVGRVRNGGQNRIRSVWFARERDITLPVTVSRVGSGTVTSTPSGISCGATCTFGFPLESTVTLSASGTAGATFIGWSGACSGTGTCVVTMDEARQVTANFLPAGTVFRNGFEAQP